MSDIIRRCPYCGSLMVSYLVPRYGTFERVDTCTACSPMIPSTKRICERLRELGHITIDRNSLESNNEWDKNIFRFRMCA